MHAGTRFGPTRNGVRLKRICLETLSEAESFSSSKIAIEQGEAMNAASDSASIQELINGAVVESVSYSDQSVCFKLNRVGYLIFDIYQLQVRSRLTERQSEELPPTINVSEAFEVCFSGEGGTCFSIWNRYILANNCIGQKIEKVFINQLGTYVYLSNDLIILFLACKNAANDSDFMYWDETD